MTRNIGLKLLSLMGAFLIWLLVANINDPIERKLIRDVSIEMVNTDSVIGIDKVLSIVEDDVYGATVIIRVRERKSVLRQLSASDFRVVADMENMNAMGSVPLRVECSNPAVTLDEMDLIPSNMKVEVEEKKQSEFAVTVATVGKQASGYEVGKTSVVQGKTVQIAGPESLLKIIGKVETTVRINGIKTDQRLSGTIAVYDKNGTQFTTSQMSQIQIMDSAGALITDNILEVDVTLWEILEDIPVIVETSGTPAEGYQVTGVTTVPVTVNLAGTREALAGMDGVISVKTPVSIEGAAENVTQEVDLSETFAELEDIRLASGFDSVVSVTVSIEKNGDQRVEVPLSNLEILNRPDSEAMSLVFSPADVIAVSVHADDETSRLNVNDITARIDLSVCEEEGVHEIPVEIELPEGFSLASEVKLTVTATAQKKDEAASTEEAEG